LNEGIAFFVVVMEVDLDIRNTETHDLREPVEDFTLVLLLGIEKGVLCGFPAESSGASWATRGHFSRQRATRACAVWREAPIPHGS